MLRAIVLAFLLFAGARPARAVTFDVRDTGLSVEERHASDALLADAVARLPPAWAAALDRTLVVEWRDDLPTHVDGRYTPDRIRLRRALLGDVMRADADAPRSRTAIAAVLHELAHAWDRSTRNGLSRDSRLLDLAGWPVAPLRAGMRVATNDFHDRTPDAYELTSSSEFVAVNLEHFLLDTDYACRRPALHRYFAARTGMATSEARCPSPVVVQPDAGGASDPSILLALDPARIAGVDYLLADPDAQPMSRWGHAMLRLIVCAPGRTRGPDCRLDVASHVVLSFRAFVDDVQLSSWRGLTGGYPSRLFVLPMQQVIEEYTKVELRGLRSIPLVLRDDEIATLIERAAQVHWTYDGRYRFITRNCAVETYRLLHDGVPRLASMDVASITPTGLLRNLSDAGVADMSVIDDADAARRLGYRFDAFDTHYQTLLDIARRAMPIPQHRVADWLDASPSDRGVWIDRTDLRGAAALLVLENAALRRVELRAADALKRRLLHGRTASARSARRNAETALALADSLSRPASLLPTGYGLPQPDELAAIDARVKATASDWSARRQMLVELAEQSLGERDRDALNATRANVAHLTERIRALAASR